MVQVFFFFFFLVFLFLLMHVCQGCLDRFPIRDFFTYQVRQISRRISFLVDDGGGGIVHSIYNTYSYIYIHSRPMFAYNLCRWLTRLAAVGGRQRWMVITSLKGKRSRKVLDTGIGEPLRNPATALNIQQLFTFANCLRQVHDEICQDFVSSAAQRRTLSLFLAPCILFFSFFSTLYFIYILFLYYLLQGSVRVHTTRWCVISSTIASVSSSSTWDDR